MQKQPIIFGEVLFDCFPDGSKILGGAPFNVAWHLKAFELDPLMVTGVGNDDEGNAIQKEMQRWGMRTNGVLVDDKRSTGVVSVNIKNNEPCYDIVDNSAWDNICVDDLPVNNGMLYHGTLALRHDVSRNALLAIRRASEKIFIDINLRSPWYNIHDVRDLICDADWLKLNEQEIREVVPDFKTDPEKLDYLHQQLGIKNIVLTRGEAGATYSGCSGEQTTVKPRPADTIVDTVGAGDALSSVTMLGIINEWPIDQTLERAQQFASAIVQQKGATVSTREFYSSIMEGWR